MTNTVTTPGPAPMPPEAARAHLASAPRGSRDFTQPRRAPGAGSPARQRSVSRVVHLVAGSLIAVYIYAPAVVGDVLQPLLAYIVVPAVTVTGIFLWKQAQLRKLAKRLTRRSPRA